jgi:HK97 gp10 family phage protein
MNIRMKTYGLEAVKRHARRMAKEVDKTFKPLVQAIAKTAQNKARELAPKRTGAYYRSIYGLIESAIRGRIVAKRGSGKGGEKGGNGHGYLGGLLEYGTVKMSARPHLKIALEYALKVHEKDIDRMINGLLGG